MENLLGFFDELVDAVEATLAAKTARIYAAITAVRTILLAEANHGDTFFAHSADDAMSEDNDVHHDSANDDSSDHTCESESEPASGRGPARGKSCGRSRKGSGRRGPQHFNLGHDSDPELRHHRKVQLPKPDRGRKPDQGAPRLVHQDEAYHPPPWHTDHHAPPDHVFLDS